jgi:YVTN family beta-propeller protein
VIFSAAGIDGPAARTVVLRVTDSDGLSAASQGAINITNVAPALISVSDNGPVNEGTAVVVTASATDAGPDTLTYLFDFDNDGIFEVSQANPSASHTYVADGTYTVQVKAKDDDGGESAVMMTVVQVNNVPPSINLSDNTSVDEGSLLMLNVSAPDAGSADVVTLAVSGLPPGAIFIQTSGNPATGTLSWTPAYTQSGSYDGITFTATDDAGGSTTRRLTLNVNEKGQPVVAVTNTNDRSITLIDAQTIEVAETEPVGKKPTDASLFDVFFDSFALPAKLYVAEREKRGDGQDDGDDEDDYDDDSKGTVRVLLGTAAPTVATAFDLATSAHIGVGNRPAGLGLNPAGTQLWVANRNDDSISLIDRATDMVIGTIPLKLKEVKGGKEHWKEIGKRPVAVGFSPDGKYAYVIGRNSQNLMVIDTASYAVLGSVWVGDKPAALAVSADGGTVYAIHRDRGRDNVAVVDVINPAVPSVLTQIPVGERPGGIALLNDGAKLYVTSGKRDSVWVFHVLTEAPYLSLLTSIPVGREPSGIAVTRPGSFAAGDYVYVANHDDNSVLVIDATSDTIVATIQVGKGPKGIAAGIMPTAP